MGINFDQKFVRKTRMGGHMLNTLKKAGLANVGVTDASFLGNDASFYNNDPQIFNEGSL